MNSNAQLTSLSVPMLAIVWAYVTHLLDFDDVFASCQVFLWPLLLVAVLCDCVSLSWI